jgi:soluble lytic murein transglycosylase-like protein
MRKILNYSCGFFLNFIVFLIIVFFLALFPFPSQSQTAENLKKQYDGMIKSIARKHNIEPNLVHSIISEESNYNRLAISPKGAVGIMQLMPETAKEYGVKDLLDPRENIEGGVKYLKDLFSLFSGKKDLILAAYNAGQEAIKKFGGIPPYQETRNYISRVMTSYKKLGTQAKIYKFYDASGRLILTNDPHLYLISKGT